MSSFKFWIKKFKNVQSFSLYTFQSHFMFVLNPCLYLKNWKFCVILDMIDLKQILKIENLQWCVPIYINISWSWNISSNLNILFLSFLFFFFFFFCMHLSAIVVNSYRRWEVDLAIQVKILNKAVCVSQSTNTPGERYKYNYSPSSYC